MKVIAKFTDRDFGYDRWIADQVGSGKPAILLIFDTEAERDAAMALKP